MNPFSKIFVVNLDNEIGQERLGVITNHFAGHQIEFERFKATEMKRGAWGLLWTMKRLFVKCVTENLDNVLVFEDDASLQAPFWPFIDDVWPQLPKEYHALYLGINLLSQPDRVSQNILKVRSAYATHAIVYSLTGIRLALQALDSLENNTCLPYDIVLMRELQSRGQCYCTIPQLALQRIGFSSIEGGQKDWATTSNFTFRAHTLHV
jgi:GR25 family glycosyltransferase involved in LPS biosynthesis